MRVCIPIAGDPANPRPSGIISFATGLGSYLTRRGVDVEFLCAGGQGEIAGCKLTSIAPEGSSEIDFSRHLARYTGIVKGESKVVYVANTELYAWALRHQRPSPSILLILHGPTFPSLMSRRPIVGIAFRTFVEPLAVKAARLVVAIDREAARYVSERYPDKRLKRIPLPVDTDLFAPQETQQSRKKWGVEARPTLLFVGRLAPEKNPFLAVDTLRHVALSVSDACLIFAGTGPLERKLRLAQGELGSDRLQLVGHVPRLELPSLYGLADALLITSVVEQMPSVLLESLACGTQVVSTSVGDVGVVLTDDRLGAIARPTAESFAEALEARFPENESDRAKYAPLRRAAVEPHSWESLGPRFLEAINEAL